MVFIYIVRCSDGSYYTGITAHLQQRFTQHSKRQVSYTKNKLPLILEHLEHRPTRKEAAQHERRIKTTGAKKYLLRFVKDDNFTVVDIDSKQLINICVSPILLANFVAAR